LQIRPDDENAQTNLRLAEKMLKEDCYKCATECNAEDLCN
jgi:hypothetical protein